MKEISKVNTESIVFVVEDEQTRPLLGMLLAATDLDARIYSNCDEFMVRHDSSRTQYLVLDMPFPGMEGLIIRQREIVNGELSVENPGIFEGIPVKTRQTCESSLFTRPTSNAVILNNADETVLSARELRL